MRVENEPVINGIRPPGGRRLPYRVAQIRHRATTTVSTGIHNTTAGLSKFICNILPYKTISHPNSYETSYIIIIILLADKTYFRRFTALETKTNFIAIIRTISLTPQSSREDFIPINLQLGRYTFAVDRKIKIFHGNTYRPVRYSR